MTASFGSPEPTSRRWWVALGIALSLHGLVGLMLAGVDPFATVEVAPAASRPLDLVFTPPAPDAATESSETPDYFTELPPDRADQAPERAEALSNVDARARDEVAGDQTTRVPRLTGQGQAPAVPIERAPADVPVPVAAGEDGEDVSSVPETAEGSEGETVAAEESTPAEDGTFTMGEPEEAGAAPQRMAGDARATLEQGAPQAVEETDLFRIEASGESEISQEAMANPDGNAPLFGAVSLNTMAWDYAPWMQRFTRDFHRNWRPPFAYMMGIIHGQHRVRIEVAKDGRLLDLKLLEEDGHVSLAQASIANLQGIAPLKPLPDRFPEETLILHLTITYQQWKRPR